HRHPQHATSCASVGLHGFPIPWQAGRVWTHRPYLHDAGEEGDGRLHHWQVRLIGGCSMGARLHTDRHYEEELKELHLKILQMGGFVEKQITNATAALIDRDDDLARLTIDRDHSVNRMDVEIDDLCIRLLALHQPAAKDLRLITTGLKINAD